VRSLRQFRSSTRIPLSSDGAGRTMETVLLIGQESPFLRIVAAVLRQDWPVYSASTERSLETFLGSSHPNVVVFDHTHPLDLHELNPRRFGFTGPLLLLAPEPSTAVELLQADSFIRRPNDLLELARLIEGLLGRSKGDQ
jgi:hypothetical protein